MRILIAAVATLVTSAACAPEAPQDGPEQDVDADLSVPEADPAQPRTPNLRIVSPDEPLPPTCFAIDTPTQSGALQIEEIEGEAIDGLGYGNMTAQSGEAWGFDYSVQGVLDGAVLTLKLSMQVDGDVVEEDHQWEFVDGGIMTHMGLYSEVECDLVEQEILRRSTR